MDTIDLNCDMAELVDGSELNYDIDIMPYISSANVCCGFHSGTPAIIERTIRAAMHHQVKIGAHPSYNDRVHFGRKSIKFNPSELLPEIRYQICAVKGMVESLGGRLHHVKPHGALYNDMVDDRDLSVAIVKLIKEIDPELKIYGLAESMLANICAEQSMIFVHEGFADRTYQSKTKLRSRKLEHSVKSSKHQVLNQVERLLNGKVRLFSGEEAKLTVESICLHSDTAGAVELSKAIHAFVTSKNIQIG